MSFVTFWNNSVRVITRYGMLFVSGTLSTLWLSFVTVLVGTIIGGLIALVRMKSAEKKLLAPVKWITTAYVEVIRGTPMLLQLYISYFLLPDIMPFAMSERTCILLALCLNSSAYVSEIIRAGIQAVDRGQTEAARCLGLSAGQAMTKVVLPQAVKNILPALCNEFVTIIKETSLASTFFIGDLMTTYKTISAAIYLNLEPLVMIGIIYFFLSFSLSKGIAALERRLHAGD